MNCLVYLVLESIQVRIRGSRNSKGSVRLGEFHPLRIRIGLGTNSWISRFLLRDSGVPLFWAGLWNTSETVLLAISNSIKQYPFLSASKLNWGLWKAMFGYPDSIPLSKSYLQRLITKNPGNIKKSMPLEGRSQQRNPKRKKPTWWKLAVGRPVKQQRQVFTPWALNL